MPTRDEEFEEIESKYRGDDMQISGTDLPKSTVACAVALWGVLFGLGAWTLSLVSDMRAEVKSQGANITAVNNRVDRVERDIEQHSRDIRELQRK